MQETLLPYILSEIPVVLWHGLEDAILFDLGDRFMIQNLTWNGAQGFHSPPTTPITLDGIKRGVFHHERGLSYAEIKSKFSIPFVFLDCDESMADQCENHQMQAI
jgi:carboxypeptidase D